MSRFTPDFKAAHAGIPVVEDGRQYEVLCTKVAAFHKEKDDGSESCGTMMSLKVVGVVNADGSLDEGIDLAGSPISSPILWVHTDNAWGMSKQTILAFAGYYISEESEANEEFFSEYQNFGIDTPPEVESPELGADWQVLVGKRARCTLVGREWNSRMQQDFKNWSPVR
jgi:hypothetical protein